MPSFELVTRAEAELKSASGKRAEILTQYMGFIERLEDGQAGKLQASEGETTGAVRRRLGAAAKLAGVKIVIKRAGDQVFFWKDEGVGNGRRRGRSRKS